MFSLAPRLLQAKRMNSTQGPRPKTLNPAAPHFLVCPELHGQGARFHLCPGDSCGRTRKHLPKPKIQSKLRLPSTAISRVAGGRGQGGVPEHGLVLEQVPGCLGQHAWPEQGLHQGDGGVNIHVPVTTVGVATVAQCVQSGMVPSGAKENLKAQSRSTTSSSILDKLEPRKTKSEKGGVATTGDEDMDKMDDINTDVDVDVAEVVDIVGYKRRSYNNSMSQDVWAMLRRRRPCSPSPPWPAHPPGPRP
mgnify:CR=1 FL=1